MTADDLKVLRNAYNKQANSAKRRLDKLGNQIEMKMSFEEWLKIWVDSGHLHERGNRKGQYCRLVRTTSVITKLVMSKSKHLNRIV